LERFHPAYYLGNRPVLVLHISVHLPLKQQQGNLTGRQGFFASQHVLTPALSSMSTKAWDRRIDRTDSRFSRDWLFVVRLLRFWFRLGIPFSPLAIP
jgi:hypothetical protein